jgi:hypothetical protein
MSLYLELPANTNKPGRSIFCFHAVGLQAGERGSSSDCCIYERVIPGTESPETIGSLFKAAVGIYRIFYPMTAGFCARG